MAMLCWLVKVVKKLNDEQSVAFKAGISTAISLIGKFPLSLDRTVNPIDLDDLEDKRNTGIRACVYWMS